MTIKWLKPPLICFIHLLTQPKWLNNKKIKIKKINCLVWLGFSSSSYLFKRIVDAYQRRCRNHTWAFFFETETGYLLFLSVVRYPYHFSIFNFKTLHNEKEEFKTWQKKSSVWVFKFTFDRWDHSLRGQSSHFPFISNEFHKWALNKWMCCCPLPKKFFFTFCNKRCLAALIIICSTFFFWILLSYDVGTFSVSLFSNSHFFRKLFFLYLPNICDGCLSNP